MSNQQIRAIAEAIRVAYLRGTRDPEKKGLAETIVELRDYVIANLSASLREQLLAGIGEDEPYSFLEAGTDKPQRNLLRDHFRALVEEVMGGK